MNYFKQQGPVLLKNGYRIVKIAARGKNPIESGWTTKVITKEDCENDNAADRSVGIICGEDVICIDADINNGNVASGIKEFIRRQYPDCIIPTRYGKRPKFAMLFRNAHNLPPSSTSIYEKMEDGERVKIQIEFRGRNQQFVAYGIHPVTNKDYEWEGGMECSPELIRVNELPVLTAEFRDEIEQKLDELALGEGFSTQHSSSGALVRADSEVTPEDRELGHVHRRLGKTISQYEKDLFDSNLNPADYKDWITAGQAGHFEFEADPEAMEVWNKWSQQAHNYKDHAEIEAKWRSFRSDRESVITYHTLLTHVPNGMEKAGYVVNDRLLAVAVAEYHRGTVKFIPDTNRWMMFVKGHWEERDAVYVHGANAEAFEYIFAKKAREYMANPSLKKALFGLKRKFDTNPPALLDKVLASLVKIGSVVAEPDVFDADRRYFGVGNGDIDLTTGEFLEPDPLRFVAKHTKINYVQGADCPRWKQTLKECLMDDEMVDYFQRLIGQAALGQTNNGLLVFLYGGGCNGKSTVLEVLRAVFGDYQRTASQDVFFGSNGGTTRADLIDLKGARLIELPETERGGRFNATQMKRITGGDEISVRAPYAPKQERFSIIGVPFIATNYYPNIQEADDGTWRRIRTVEFRRNFEKDKEIKKDEHLREKLALEYEGVLNWVIEGALKAQKVGLEPPKKVLEDVNAYRRDSDLVGQFVEERLVIDGNDKSRIACSSMFKLWQNFCAERGDNGGIRTAAALTGELTRRYGWKRPKIHGYYHFKGVCQKEDYGDTGED